MNIMPQSLPKIKAKLLPLILLKPDLHWTSVETAVNLSLLFNPSNSLQLALFKGRLLRLKENEGCNISPQKHEQ